MRILASIKLRIFLTAWIVFALHFATNVVREHYPAFGLAERCTLRCDEYLGFHSDIFQHTDGHAYITNNVFASAIAAVPLFAFDPLLDRLEARSKRALAEAHAPPEIEYDTVHKNREEFWRKVVLAGLDLRFGAAAAITATLLMAPISALVAVLMFHLLERRNVPRGRATWLAFLFAFGTPVFYRSAHLSHNAMLMAAAFGAFALLWVRPDQPPSLPPRRTVLAGMLAGFCVALDYSGLIPCAALWLYLVFAEHRRGGRKLALRSSLPFFAGCIPGIAFLLWSQWAMFGSPFTPPQRVMPAVNFTEEGLRGFGWPSLEIFLKNLLAPGYGLLPFAPLLFIAFLPHRREPRLVPSGERRFIWFFTFAFLLFCASNRYSLMQFNTGFRYLLPLVPFLFLLASEHLARMRRGTLVTVSTLAIFHTWVLSMMREVRDTEKELRDLAVARGIPELSLDGYWHSLFTETAIPLSYRRLLDEGLQLPWLTVLSRTQSTHRALLSSPWLAAAILAITAAVIFLLWNLGSRAERERGDPSRIGVKVTDPTSAGR